MEQANRVIIVGAGPVGLTAALLLQRRGIPFVVLEANADLPDDLRASTFHPPTLDMLATLGVAEHLIAQGLVSPTWQIRMHATGERALFDLAVIADSTGHPYRLQCEQSKLCRILKDRIVAEGGDVRMGFAAEAVAQDADSVTVIARGADGETERFAGTFLIGADGSRSAIRHALGFAFEGKTYPETTILATTHFPFEDHLSGLSNVNYVWKEGGTFSLLRLPSVWRCSLYPDGEETIEQALEPASIARKLQEIAPSPDGHKVEEIRPYRIHMRIVDDYRAGRVLLAGDAAHVNSPSGGMGMNGGIHDAINLTGRLAEVWHGSAADAELDRYDTQRRLVTLETIQTQTIQNKKNLENPEPFAQSLAQIKADPKRTYDYLLRVSMIATLRRAAELG